MEETTAVFGEDLVVEILLNLPCKSLMRFKCVSKSWYALINSPWFKAKHLSFLSSKNSNIEHLLVMKKNTFNNSKNDDGEIEEEEFVFSLLNICKVNNGGMDTVEDKIIVSSVKELEFPLRLKQLTRGCQGYMVGHCNGIICLYLSQFILWNPAIQDFKLLPVCPYFSPEVPGDLGIQGFGYDPKLNEYKFVDCLLDPSTHNFGADAHVVSSPVEVAIYSLSTDSWKKIKTDALEKETTLLWPDSFQLQFKDMLCWLGDERFKDVHILDYDSLIIRQIIILLDIHSEVFYDIELPYCFNKPETSQAEPRPTMALRVWNESLSLFVLADIYNTHLVGERWSPEYKDSFVIWVMDEFGGPTGASWTKQVTLQPNENPLGFPNSNDIPLGDFMRFVCSYDLGSKRTPDGIFRQNSPFTVPPNCDYDSHDFAVVAYVKSIVTVSEAHNHKLQIIDNSSVANLSPLSYFPSSSSIANSEWYSYSVWAIPSPDASLRIKKVMESLRIEFGGPEIEPHIPIVTSIHMTYENALDKFRSLSLKDFHPFQAKVNLLDTKDFYYQCVSLLINLSDQLNNRFKSIIENSEMHFGFFGYPADFRILRLSVLYGDLTEEERKVAVEKVSILDESISRSSFTVSQLALYRIDYRDTPLKSWERIAEYNLPLP